MEKERLVPVNATPKEWQVVQDALEFVLDHFAGKPDYEENRKLLLKFFNDRFQVWCRDCGFIQYGCECKEGEKDGV